VAAGFVDFEITWRADVFSGAPQTTSAAAFGTLGINFRARKPQNPQEWEAAWAALMCEVSPNASGTTASTFGANVFYDAGDKGCGAGPLNEIADLMVGLASDQTLEIRATDPSVAVDLTAWCRLTGHTLVTQEGDRYLIRHK
jgi:tRNA 2-thiouridine synthesizing protein A